MILKFLKKLLIKDKLKILFFLFIFSTSLQNYSNANIIQNIEIDGNVRIPNETIISFLSLENNQQIDSEKINEITKTLYESNFFSNVSIEFKNNKLFIFVTENPIIQEIIFDGIKSKDLLNSITAELKLVSRSSFVKIYADQDLSKMLSNLKNSGYFFSKIDTSIEDLGDNKINLIYNINLGKKAKIKKISFIGNKIFKDNKLRGVILSEEYKFWKFISNKKYLNENLVELDKRYLKNFYINNGYYNAIISSSYAKLIDEDQFELVFNINSGNKIYFGNLDLILPTNYDQNDFIKLRKTFKGLQGNLYSINLIEKIVNEINNLALYEQYETINVEVLESFRDNYLDITFKVDETKKIPIKRINILGNNVTVESVIRNQFEIDEGDFYNEILFNKTINNIKSLNFFKDVKGNVIDDFDKNIDSKIIDIEIEEKPTGEIGAAAGAGTNGATLGFFIKENNYLGRGIGLEANFTLNEDSIKGLFAIENPNFKDSDKSIYGRVEASETNKLTQFGYKTNRTGFAYGTNFELFDDLNFGIGNKNFYEKIETSSSASALLKKQKGNYYDSFINFDFDYDKRNQKFKTTDGFRSFYSLNMPIISKTNTLSNIYQYTSYTELYDENVTSFSFYVKSSHSISNDDIKLSERNFLPSNKLRGFVTDAVGPKDGNDYIGGNYASSVNIASTLPKILPTNQNIDFLIFLDAGNIWGVDYDSSINNSNKIRSSAGLAVDWFTIVGPLNFSLSLPITKAETDKTETFRFNIGTTF